MTFTPSFRRTIDLISSQKLHMTPFLRNAVEQCAFPDEFTVTFRNYAADRKPDGWFHPSTHPTLGERQLYLYLTQPDYWVKPPFAWESRMSVMMGTALHDLTAVVLTRMGILLEPTGTCVNCGRPHGRGEDECSEWGVIDRVLGRRGHIDGLTELPSLDGTGVYDLKTCNPMVIKDIPDHDIEAFKKKWPYYYGQQQDYLAMTGKAWSLVVFLGVSQGWPTKEFLIPRDEAYITALEAKYRAVRRYEANGTLPPVACCPGGATARKCPATTCPIKIG